jgi:hypothetical protein
MRMGGGGGGQRFAGPRGMDVKPIKGFVTARAKSVADQLAARSQGYELAGGFGPGGGRRGGGGPEGFSPGALFSGAFLGAMDTNKDGQLSRQEFSGGFIRWFEKWNASRSGMLSEDELRAGINRDLVPTPPGGNRDGGGLGRILRRLGNFGGGDNGNATPPAPQPNR